MIVGGIVEDEGVWEEERLSRPSTDVDDANGIFDSIGNGGDLITHHAPARTIATPPTVAIIRPMPIQSTKSDTYVRIRRQ